MAANLFVGIDLGGSGTRAALADADGAVLATGRGPSGLHGGSSGRRILARALDRALAPIAARVRDAETSVFAGTRGLSVPGRRELVELELTTRFPSVQVQVSNDALIGLWGGLAGQPGVAVLAGSGSIALARNLAREEGRAGGWGYLLGDEGSGYWIGREALRCYLGTLEHRHPAGALTDILAAHVGRTALIDVLAWFYAGQDQVERLAALAPLASHAAEAGDAMAIEILQRAGRTLADLAAAAANQIAGAEATVACTGGVWAAHTSLHEAFAARLQEVLPGAQRVEPRLPPVGGALLLAMGAAQLAVYPRVVDRLMATL